MRVHYTGKIEPLTAAEEKRLAARFAKLGKLLDGKSEKEAHVILGKQRQSHRAEITVNYYDHPLASESSGPDQAASLASALDKLEKQILKLRAKRRDGKRRLAAPPTQEASGREPARPRVFRVNGPRARKPMTAEEAILELGDKKDYLVYRDAETDRTSVVIRRRDGHVDLIEA